jgi:outer membrane protein assembly factor BamE (lipoprotein component of BamABCDE complex)
MNSFLHYDAVKIVRLFVLTFSLTLLSYSNNSVAQSIEVEELKLKIEELKKRVQELESLNYASASNVKIKKATGNPWHSLKVNMSKTEVTSLLGKPGKVDKWKTGEAWYFPNSKGGEVDFDANENVTGWLEP